MHVLQVGVYNSLLRKKYLLTRYLINCTCRWCEHDAEEWDLKLAGWQCMKCSAPVICHHALDKREAIGDWNVRCLRCIPFDLLLYPLCSAFMLLSSFSIDLPHQAGWLDPARCCH